MKSFLLFWFLSLFLFFVCSNARNLSLRHSSAIAFSAISPSPSVSTQSNSSIYRNRTYLHRLHHHHHHHILKTAIFVGISVFAVAVLLSLIYSRLHCLKSQQKSDPGKIQSTDIIRKEFLHKLSSLTKPINGELCPAIQYSRIEAATNNFSQDNIIGYCKDYCYYRASLEDCSFAIVKSLNRECKDFEFEFKNEVEFLSRIQHSNIISCLGYCNERQTRIIVYEFLQNGSLEKQLHGPSRGSLLTWNIRMKIILDIARGLEYLHEHCDPPIFHRDIKASNILLDSNFNAKISDFGLAMRIGRLDISKNLSRTPAYVAPEYFLNGIQNEKLDIYAFGIIILELLMGRKPIKKVGSTRNQTVMTWDMPQITDRSKLPSIIDPVIRNTMDSNLLLQVAAVAFLCIQPEPSYRPSIIDVINSLASLVSMDSLPENS